MWHFYSRKCLHVSRKVTRLVPLLFDFTFSCVDLGRRSGIRISQLSLHSLPTQYDQLDRQPISQGLENREKTWISARIGDDELLLIGEVSDCHFKAFLFIQWFVIIQTVDLYCKACGASFANPSHLSVYFLVKVDGQILFRAIVCS